MSFIFQTFNLFPALTAFENVRFGADTAERPDGEARTAEALEQVGLGDRADHFPHQLSGGEQQRVAIARAFAADPALLFADEPTGNLDQRTGERVIELLFELNRERGTTLVLVTHDLRLADPCDRTVELEAGALVSDLGDAPSPVARIAR